MSSSTSLLDLLSQSQASAEITANALFNAGSPATIFGRRDYASSGLTWAYYGGRMLIDGTLTAIANGSVALTASSTNYVQATRAGVVSANTTAFTAGSIPLYTVVAGASTVTSYTDERDFAQPSYVLQKSASISVAAANVTLSAAQARCRYLTISGALTVDRTVTVPSIGEWVVYNATTGAFTLTIKRSSGTGIVVTQTMRAILIADGTNVVRVTADTA